jgi:Mannosyl-glycoprotein endo-beta-N-acetylglucosaminidase
MTFSRVHARRRVVAASVCTILAVVAASLFSVAPARAADALTPVMGANILNADQLAAWFNAKRSGQTQPRLPALNNDIHALAQIFLDEGAREGVRGDIAFVQSIIETGWFVFSDSGQIRPEFNNYAGINAFGGRRKGTTCAEELYDAPSATRCYATPQLGVRAQMHLLRGYADPLSRYLPDRLRMPPSDRIGLAPWWEYFGGNSPTGKLIWASAPDYGIRILNLFSNALMFNGLWPLGGYPDVTPPVAILNTIAAAQSSSAFTVGWWGQDFESGILGFNVEVSDNGGPWIRWLDHIAPRWIARPAYAGDFTYFGVAGHTYTFRVQAVDSWGNASAFSAEMLTTLDGAAARTTEFSSAYVMSRGGDLSTISSPPMASPDWGAMDAIRGFALRTQGGGYEVDYSGGIRPVGDAPNVAQNAYFGGWDIVRGLALNPDGNGGYVLDGFGGIWPFGNAQPVVTAGYFSGWDIARDIVMLPTSTATNPAGYMMDGWGGLHPFGAAPPITAAGYWPGWDIARDVIVNPNGPGGWVLDGWGGLAPFNDAPPLTISRYFHGVDIARGVAVYNGPNGLVGYVLDAWGSLHSVNGASPSIVVTHYWPGRDYAKFVAINP